MNYQSYEDYMRQVLGYSMQRPNEIYETYPNRNFQNTYYENEYSDMNNLYPEIYHLVNPMVCKVCQANTNPITKELIEKMTDEVYDAIENKETNRGEVKTEELKQSLENRAERTPRRLEERRPEERRLENRVEEKRAEVRREDRKENRDRNSTLRDLIKILILNQLIWQNRPVGRPPYPGGPRNDATTPTARS